MMTVVPHKKKIKIPKNVSYISQIILRGMKKVKKKVETGIIKIF